MMFRCSLRRNALHSAEREEVSMARTEALTFAGTHGMAVVTVADPLVGALSAAARAGIREGRGRASLTREAQA